MHILNCRVIILEEVVDARLKNVFRVGVFSENIVISLRHLHLAVQELGVVFKMQYDGVVFFKPHLL